MITDPMKREMTVAKSPEDVVFPVPECVCEGLEPEAGLVALASAVPVEMTAVRVPTGPVVVWSMATIVAEPLITRISSVQTAVPSLPMPHAADIRALAPPVEVEATKISAEEFSTSVTEYICSHKNVATTRKEEFEYEQAPPDSARTYVVPSDPVPTTAPEAISPGSTEPSRPGLKATPSGSVVVTWALIPKEHFVRRCSSNNQKGIISYHICM